MAQLPPHLRQYVEPAFIPPAQMAAMQANYSQQQPPPPATGPKPQYDYRRMNDQCDPVAVDADPGAVGWASNANAVEYVDRPQIKLQRTFGRDGKRLNIEGNTVHHPTGRQRLKYPVNGREADNFLRRMTGHDPHRRARGTVMNPTLMPDSSLGPNGEWGDSIATPAISLEDRAIEALNEMNPNTMGNSMLPFIRPDIRQWREKPVSYAKPTPQVRGPIIPPSRAGIFYQANPIGKDPRYSDPLPTLPNTVEGRRRPESIEHMQLPRESNKEASARAVMAAPVPHLNLGPTARADQTPFEDYAHNVVGNKAAPLMLRAIKRYHKKLQQPHSLGYGAGIHDGDEMAGAFDAASVSVPVTADASAQRVAAVAREQPDATLPMFTGGDGLAGDYDVRNAAGVSVDLTDEATGVQRDFAATQQPYHGVDGVDEGDYASSVLARGQRVRAPVRDALPDESDPRRGFLLDETTGDDAVAGASTLVTPRDVRQATGERSYQKRDRSGVQLRSYDRIDAASELMDGRDAIGSIRLSNKHGDDDRALRATAFDRGTLVDEELASIADHPSSNDFGQRVRRPREPEVLAQHRAGAHMVGPSGDDSGTAIDSSATTRASMAQIGDILDRLRRLEGERSQRQASGAEYRARTAAFSGEEGVADNVSVGSLRLKQTQRRADVRDAHDTMRGLGHGVVEYDSARATVGMKQERAPRPSSAPVLRDERFEAGRGLDDGMASVADTVDTGSRARAPRADALAGFRSVADTDVAGDASFGMHSTGTIVRAPQRDRIPIGDHHRSAFSLVEGDAGYGVADSIAQRYGTSVHAPRADAQPNDARVGGYGAIHEQFEPSFADQRVDTRAHAPVPFRREASVANLRRDNPDSDALTSLSRATTGAPQADAPHARFADREERSLNNPANYFKADEMHNTVGNEMLIAPPTTHLGHVHERTDGHESGVEARLRNRLRRETPPPASFMERNARFGRMVSPRSSSRSSPRPASVVF